MLWHCNLNADYKQKRCLQFCWDTNACTKHCYVIVFWCHLYFPCMYLCVWQMAIKWVISLAVWGRVCRPVLSTSSSLQFFSMSFSCGKGITVYFCPICCVPCVLQHFECVVNVSDKEIRICAKKQRSGIFASNRNICSVHQAPLWMSPLLWTCLHWDHFHNILYIKSTLCCSDFTVVVE